jgi:hypothetical protein
LFVVSIGKSQLYDSETNGIVRLTVFRLSPLILCHDRI